MDGNISSYLKFAFLVKFICQNVSAKHKVVNTSLTLQKEISQSLHVKSFVLIDRHTKSLARAHFLLAHLTQLFIAFFSSLLIRSNKLIEKAWAITKSKYIASNKQNFNIGGDRNKS